MTTIIETEELASTSGGELNLAMVATGAACAIGYASGHGWVDVALWAFDSPHSCIGTLFHLDF